MKLDILNKLTQLVNPLVRWLLRSRFHATVSANIVLLTHFGRKSRRPYPTPVTYVQEGNTLRIATLRAGWWKNLAANPDVKVVLRGEERAGRASVIVDDHARIAAGIRDILSKVPRDATFYEVRINGSEPNLSDVENAAARTVLIELELGSSG